MRCCTSKSAPWTEDPTIACVKSFLHGWSSIICCLCVLWRPFLGSVAMIDESTLPLLSVFDEVVIMTAASPCTLNGKVVVLPKPCKPLPQFQLSLCRKSGLYWKSYWYTRYDIRIHTLVPISFKMYEKYPWNFRLFCMRNPCKDAPPQKSELPSLARVLTWIAERRSGQEYPRKYFLFPLSTWHRSRGEPRPQHRQSHAHRIQWSLSGSLQLSGSSTSCSPSLNALIRLCQCWLQHLDACTKRLANFDKAVLISGFSWEEDIPIHEIAQLYCVCPFIALGYVWIAMLAPFIPVAVVWLFFCFRHERLDPDKLWPCQIVGECH